MKTEIFIEIETPDGKFSIPAIFGILKDVSGAELLEQLKHPLVATRYTREAMRIANEGILNLFPKAWLRIVLDTHLAKANIPEARRKWLLSYLAD